MSQEPGGTDRNRAGWTEDLSATEWARITAGCRRRDGDAFTELVEQTQHRLRRLLGRMTSPQADLDELLQETYLRAWKQIDRFRGDSSLTTWMTRIAMNVALNWRRDRRPTVPLPDEHPGMQSSTALDEQALLDAYAEALAGLPPELRAPFVLHETEGLSYRQIAEVLDCPIGTVMSRLHRARAQLLAVLRDRLEELLP